MAFLLVRSVFILAGTSRVFALSFLRPASTDHTPSLMPLMSKSIFYVSEEQCDAEQTVSKWARNDTKAAKIISTWAKYCPDGLLQHDFGVNGSCVDNSPFHPGKFNSHVLTLVEDYFSKQLCPAGGKHAPQRFREISPSAFNVRGTPLEERAPNRNYMAVWPYGMRQCKQDKKCPVVVYLHGRDEHAATADLHEAQTMFNLVEKWGYLRYAERDPTCAEELGSVLIFPQILVDESWVANNLALISHFVVPLVNGLSANTGLLDLDRVSIIGYSEGALGALQAALWHPGVFNFALAAAVALPNWENVSSQIVKQTYNQFRHQDHSWKLSSIVATFGHFDECGEVEINMKNALSMIRDFVGPRPVNLQFRVYAAKDHVHWESVFNQWPSLHDMLWKGEFEKETLRAVAR